jgi:hypothetical protein
MQISLGQFLLLLQTLVPVLVLLVVLALVLVLEPSLLP